MDKNIRVRFAPSPTGYLHIGGARTALYNWLLARKNGGKFILRIEDTDMDRSLADSESKILDDMTWLGLDWDEGPDKGGEYGPYRQTQRLDLYKEYAEKLIKENKAYYCYCTPEELEVKRKLAFERKENSVYDGRCRSLSQEEKQKLIDKGIKPAIRFVVRQDKVVVHDLVKGDVEFEGGFIGDFIIMKSDGTASYNFAVVIDDHLMKITHIIRGDEHLINTPRQILIYEAIGKDIPKFAHISMILAPDHTKLSKRHGTTSVGEFREKGYLPQALVNYLALLGWAPKDNREIFELKDLVEVFSTDGIAKNPAIYDIQKLNWLNRHYIKNADTDSLTKLSLVFFEKAGIVSKEMPDEKYNWFKKLNELFKEQYDHIDEIVEKSKVLFTNNIEYSDEAKEIISSDTSKKVIEEFYNKVSQTNELTSDKISEILKSIQKDTGIKGKNLYMPVRITTTGCLHGPDLPKLLELIGKEKIIKRIQR